MQLERLYGSQHGEASERQGVKWVKGFTFKFGRGQTLCSDCKENHQRKIYPSNDIVLGCNFQTDNFKPNLHNRKFKSLKDNCLKGSSWKHSDFPLPTALFKPCFAQKVGSPRSNRECHSCCLSLLNILSLVVILSQSCPIHSSDLFELPTGLPPPCPLIIAKNSWYQALEEAGGSRSTVSFGHDFRSESLHHLWHARVQPSTKVCTLKNPSSLEIYEAVAVAIYL